MTGTPRLLVSRFSGGYGDLQVFRDVDLALSAGECIGIVGPNGAGKSSLLKAIMGLCTQAGGQLELDGAPMHQYKTPQRIRAGCQFVPEGRELFSTLSAHDNIVLGAPRIKGGEQALIDSALAILPELVTILQLKVGALSGGQQQMVALARATVRRPRLLLLDEPTQGLSPINADRIYRAVTAMKNTTATIIVEQSLDRIMTVADRLCIMNEGVLSEVAAEHRHDARALEQRYFGAA
jgi:ABC-type branched-subunit amino acid transport system ATPase component